MPPVQRLIVQVKLEILGQATLSARQKLHCILPRRVIEQAEKLAITRRIRTVRSVSTARPLDSRVMSVTLHRLELTPVRASGAAAPAATAPTVRAARTHPTRQGAIMQALYGRDVWHGFAPSAPRAADIESWNGRHQLFARLLDNIPNATMIDVAIWNGQSTIFVAELMRWRNIGGCIVAVDTFLAEDHWPADSKLYARHPGCRPDVYETFLDNVFYAGVADLVVPLPAHSIAAARILAQRRVNAGLIHLDASRDYAEALRDAEAYWPLVDPGGYLVGDDYGPSWPGVIKAPDEFAAKVGLESEVHTPKWRLRKPAAIPSKV